MELRRVSNGALQREGQRSGFTSQLITRTAGHTCKFTVGRSEFPRVGDDSGSIKTDMWPNNLGIQLDELWRPWVSGFVSSHTLLSDFSQQVVRCWKSPSVWWSSYDDKLCLCFPKNTFQKSDSFFQMSSGSRLEMKVELKEKEKTRESSSIRAHDSSTAC